MIDVEAGADCLGSSASDAATENYDDNEAGAVVLVAVLHILPAMMRH